MPQSKAASGLKMNYPQLILIGMGFLASSLVWSIYNSQVPLLLSERFGMGTTVIGTIMTIDNFFGVIFQPLVGAWSDNTRTRFGRRMPWIMIGLPLCALLFLIIPLQYRLEAFMLTIIGFNLIMSLWRSPVIALMPDVTPRPLRSPANGIINLMGGIGTIIAFAVGGRLSDMREDKFYAFLMASILMLIALVILILFVREPDALAYRDEHGFPVRDTLANRWARRAQQQFALEKELADPEEEEARRLAEAETKKDGKVRSFTAFLALPKEKRRSLTGILIAIFAWFMGFNAIETFFTLFATSTYDVTGGEATQMLTGFSLAFLLFAVPAGMIGKRIGRRRTILIGIMGIVLLFIPFLFSDNLTLLLVLLLAAGGFWACININSLPMVVEFATDDTVGSFTGYYYLFSFTAAIVSPILFGFIQDVADNFSLLFWYAIACFIIALLAMLTVKHGDNTELASP